MVPERPRGRVHYKLLRMNKFERQGRQPAGRQILPDSDARLKVQMPTSRPPFKSSQMVPQFPYQTLVRVNKIRENNLNGMITIDLMVGEQILTSHRRRIKVSAS